MGRVQNIVNGSDNIVSIILYADGVPVNMVSSGITRIIIEVDDEAGTSLDSDVITSMAWNAPVDVDGQTAYPITFPGDDAGLAAGVYRDCFVRVFDNLNTTGIIWPDPVSFVVT